MDELIYTLVGKQIRAKREYKGLSQEQLANRLSLARTSITNIEKGKQRVMLHTVFQIAKALDTEVSSLLPSIGDLQAGQVITVGDTDVSSKDLRWVEQVRKAAKEKKGAS